jgi:hypothetical protein
VIFVVLAALAAATASATTSVLAYLPLRALSRYPGLAAGRAARDHSRYSPHT